MDFELAVKDRLLAENVASEGHGNASFSYETIRTTSRMVQQEPLYQVLFYYYYYYYLWRERERGGGGMEN